MKRSTKRLLSMLLAIIMVMGLAVPAMAVTFSMDEVEEAPVEATFTSVEVPAAAEAPEPDPVWEDEPEAELSAIEGANATENNETGVFALDAMDNSQLKNSAGDAAEDATGFQTGGVGEDYFTFTGKVKRKFDKSTPKNMNGVEIGSKESSSIDFTIIGKATVKIVWANGSSGKCSVLALKKGSDLVAISSAVKAPDRVVGTDAAGDLAADKTLGYVCGGAAAAVEYTWTDLEAGSYKVVAPTVAFQDVPSTIDGVTVAEGTDTDPTAKGTRVYSVVVDQTVDSAAGGGTTTTNVYTFDATKIADGADADGKSEDNHPVTQSELNTATTKDGAAMTEDYFTLFKTNKDNDGEAVNGDVIKRNTAKKGETPAAGIKALSLEKMGTGGLDFTVQGTADVTMTVCSTNGSGNVSMLALVKTSDNSIQPATMVTAGTAIDGDTKEPIAGKTSLVADGQTEVAITSSKTMIPAAGVVVAFGDAAHGTTVSYKLTEGDYRITTYDAFTGRPGWLVSATVSDVVAAGKPVTDAYTFDATKIADGVDADGKSEDNHSVTQSELNGATTKDGAAVTEDYFTLFKTNKDNDGEAVNGDVIKRNTAKKGETPAAGIKALSLEKMGTGGLDFTVQGTADVTMTVCSTNGSGNVSMLALVKTSDNSIQPATMVTAGTAVDSDTKEPIAGKTSIVADGQTEVAITSSKTMIPAAGVVVAFGDVAHGTTVSYKLTGGDYRITTYDAFTGRPGWLVSATVTDTYMSGGGKTTRVKAPWTVEGIGAAVVTPTVKGGTIEFAVSGSKMGRETVATAEGKTITTYADSLYVEVYNAAGESVGQANVMNGKTTFQPSATGKYTYKVFAKREGEADLETGNFTTPVDFTLPLAKPVIASAASNGKDAGADTASVSVMWAKVAEATSYNFQFKAHDATDWSASVAIPATDASNMTYVVAGLTVGTAYDYRVQALRNTEEGEWSAVFAADPVTATKQIPWTERTFGTSTTNASNCVVGADTKINYVGMGKEKVTADAGTYSMQFVNADGTDKGEPRVIEGLTGDLNTDVDANNVNRVLLSSRDGAGKITENSSDGLLFYYTAIPAGTNYTLTANVEVLRWATRDTQNGVGVAALDRVDDHSWTGSSGSNSGNFWNNSYMGGAARLSFAFDRKSDGTGGNTYAAVDMGYDAATKYSYYMGPLSIAKNGVNMTANGPWNESSNPANYYERRFPLDTRIPRDGLQCKVGSNSNRFNLIGNYTVQPAGFSLMHENSSDMARYELTKFKIQLQKNNTGYVTTMWDERGNLLGSNTEYFVKGAMDLSGNEPYHTGNDGIHFADETGRKDIPELQQCLDSDFEYVGLFTSRDLDALFTNVKLETVAASEDEPPETPPITKITPSMSISSGDSSNSENFNLAVGANVEGSITVVQNNKLLTDAEGNALTYHAKTNAAGVIDRVDIPVTLVEGTNSFTVTFQPDPDQTLPAYTVLANTDTIVKTSRVVYRTRFSGMHNLYVAPNGRNGNNGTKERPLDVYTAVSVVKPGQNIILLDGVYKLTKPIRINRGMDGTEENPIYFVAEPGAKVVLNGQGRSGSVLVHGSNWWVFKDFEVVGSSNGATGFQLSGSNNIVQNVDCHDNGSTGMQVSRLSSSDHIPDRTNANVGELDEVEGITDWGDWPCNNKIINCAAYRNYDTGYNGADGFGAKLTVGAGNIFDGCVAYWNADDGWDLYAKTSAEEGPIGRVTLRNCITFENGYEVRKLADVAAQKPEYEADGYTPVLNRDEAGNVILSSAGNGNGFKLGGSHLPGMHSISNSFAFYNKAKGFDSNNGPDIQISGCTGYNNGQENVGLNSKFKTTNYLVEKTVSFKDEKAPVSEADGKVQMADETPAGGTSKYDEETYYAWDGAKSANKKGVEITADSFVSLDWDSKAWAYGPVRDADGSLSLGDFLKLKDTVTNAGAGELVNDEGSKPVENPENVVNPPEEPNAPSAGGGAGGGSSSGGSSSTGVGIDKQDPVKTPDEDNTGIDTSKPASENFGDVEKDSWYEPGITYVVSKGLFQGVAQGVFAPQDNMTRAMLVTVLARLDGQDTTGGDTWYAKGAAWAVAEGVSDGTMLEQNVTRQQMVTMLYRYAGSPEVDAAMGMAGYGDVDAIDTWAADAMRWAVQNGIINGKDGARLDPQGTATRAEVATILQRFVESLDK